MQAGISTEEAVHLLQENPADDQTMLTECLAGISEEMRMGRPFSGALENTGLFPEYAVRMISAAEYTGRLETTLRHLAEYYRNEDEVMHVILSAVRYPISLLSMIIILLVVMLVVVFPAFRNVYENLSGSLTVSSYKYINTAFIVCEILLAVMVVLLVLLIIGMSMWQGGRKKGIRRLLSGIPVFKGIIRGFDLYRFSFCFHMYLSSGQMQEESFKKSMDVAETEDLRKTLELCYQDMVAGKSFSQAVNAHHLYDAVSSRLLIPAERSGGLDQALSKICEELKKKNMNQIDLIVGIVEPVLTGFLLISVGLMLISLMIPLIGIMNSIG